MLSQGKQSGRNRIDMTQGPMFVNILRFILPLIVTNLLQHFYHAADIMIVELSSEPDAMGAVGSVGSFLTLMVNLFIGFSVGANVVVAKCIGAGEKGKTSRAIHTAICMSLLFGVTGAVLGIAFVKPVLIGMGYTGNLMKLGLRYAYIYLACMPVASMTNFLSAILQAQGNTRTPMLVLASTGILNVLLNLFFVLVVGLSVEGVALATAIANLTSATILWIYLAKGRDECSLSFKKLRIDKKLFGEIARVGFPAGFQNAMFSISNMLIQSSLVQVNNALTPAGSEYAPVIKANTAMGSLEGFIFSALGAITVTSSAFTAQNMGANKYDRIKRAFAEICALSTFIGLLMSVLGFAFREPLLALYGVHNASDELSQIAYQSAFIRMLWKWPAFFVFSIMNACSGTIRGLGKSALAALIAFLGTCVLRVVWILTVFAHFQNQESIHISYPLSWLMTGACLFVVLMVLFRRNSRESEKPVLTEE